MAQTTGAISAKDCRITLGTQDISGSSNNVTLTPSLDSGQSATFDGDWKLTTAGKLSWEISIEALYTETASEATEELWDALTGGTAVAIAIQPKGDSAGNWEFSGNVIITQVEMPFDGTSGDPVIVSAEGTGTGELTKSVVTTT